MFRCADRTCTRAVTKAWRGVPAAADARRVACCARCSHSIGAMRTRCRALIAPLSHVTPAAVLAERRLGGGILVSTKPKPTAGLWTLRDPTGAVMASTTALLLLPCCLSPDAQDSRAADWPGLQTAQAPGPAARHLLHICLLQLHRTPSLLDPCRGGRFSQPLGCLGPDEGQPVASGRLVHRVGHVPLSAAAQSGGRGTGTRDAPLSCTGGLQWH